MNPLPKKNPNPLESVIQTNLINRFTIDDWYCIRTHGNEYQSGFPDIYLSSKRFGSRWIEVKRPGNIRFTQAQLDVFTKFASKNIGVWVLTENSDHERAKIFKPSNWYTYIKGGITLNGTVKRIKKFGPEGIIQDEIIEKLSGEGWFCLETYGSVYQCGLPDIFCCHAKYGTRWIECKNPNGYRFTPAQHNVFPRLAAHGVGIYVLMSASETDKLFGPHNWHHYLWK